MFKLETHLHTSEGSSCAKINGYSQAKLYKEAGYDGIIVTDHFFRGNSCIPKDLPWETRIDLFCMGYEHAKQYGDKAGLKVFFGNEETYNGIDFLIYGIDKEWMINHPEMEFYTIEEQYNSIKKAGGMVIHAHPFRKRTYIPQIKIFPKYVDGV